MNFSGYIFLCCYLDCPSCPANAVQMDRASWAAIRVSCYICPPLVSLYLLLHLPECVWPDRPLAYRHPHSNNQVSPCENLVNKVYDVLDLWLDVLLSVIIRKFVTYHIALSARCTRRARTAMKQVSQIMQPIMNYVETYYSGIISGNYGLPFIQCFHATMLCSSVFMF